MAKKLESFLPELDDDAKKLITAIRSNEGSFDDVFRASLAKHLYSRYMRDDAPEDTLAQLVAERINEEFEFTGEAELSVEWYETESDARMVGLIESQQETCQEIEQAKESLEAANDRKKACQSAIDEGHSRLRNLAKELKKPYVYPLPPAPSRQRELPLGDGEEWRLVPLAEVLKDEAALKATVLEKLGNITLGKYVEEAQKFGLGDKPKKLTRKQWDKVEASVQKWHEDQAEKEKDDEDDGDEE